VKELWGKLSTAVRDNLIAAIGMAILAFLSWLYRTKIQSGWNFVQPYLVRRIELPVWLALAAAILLLSVCWLASWALQRWRTAKTDYDFEYLGLKWKIPPEFFEGYQKVDNLSDDMIERYFKGPYCRTCSELLSMPIGRDRVYAIPSPCSLNHQHQLKPWSPVTDARRQACDEVQKLNRLGKFPPKWCG
jgi:hypothetical protein